MINGRLFPAHLRLPLLVFVAALFTLGGGGWLVLSDLGYERHEAMENAKVHAGNLAAVFENHIEQTVKRVDQALIQLRQRYQESPDTFKAVTLQWRGTPLADLVPQVSIIGADGRLIFTNIDPNAKDIDFSDREHFQVHRDSVADTLFISKPVFGRISQEWSLQFARPLKAPDGTFAGVIVARVAVDTLSQFYDTIQIGKQGAITLIGMDRVVRARSTRVLSNNTPIGFQVPHRDHFDPNTPLAGPVDIFSPIDNIRRIGAYRRLSDYPLVVLVSFGVDEVLEDYHEASRRIYSGAVLVAAFAVLSFGLVGWLTLRQARSQKALEEAQRIQASENERWRLAMEAVGDGVWDWQVPTGTVYFSPRWQAMLGYDDGELNANVDAWKERVHPEDLTRVMRDVGALLDGTTRFYANEHRLLCKDGGYKWVLARGVVVAWNKDGSPLRAVGTHTDVTDRRAIDDVLREKSVALEQSNQELEAFAYAASHDLRQPLRTVASFIKLLERELGDKLTDDAQEYMGFIRDGAQRMDRLIIDLLEYSRIGRLNQGAGNFSAGEIVDEAMANLRFAINESGGCIDTSPALPVVCGNHSELVRLFQNLIGNALKYRHPDRPLQVKINVDRAKDSPPDRQMWEFSIRDNGIGIAPEHGERIFGIFQRLHQNGVHEGSGIGLAVCRKIVQRAGGLIWLEQIPDGENGCDFRFTLPGYRNNDEKPL